MPRDYMCDCAHVDQYASPVWENSVAQREENVNPGALAKTHRINHGAFCKHFDSCRLVLVCIVMDTPFNVIF